MVKGWYGGGMKMIGVDEGRDSREGVSKNDQEFLG